MAYRTFAITLRPTDGITDEQIDAIDGWLQKVCHYHACITEKTGTARHLHAALYLSKTCTRSNLHNRILAIKGIDGTLSAIEKSVFRKGTKIMYNDDFAQSYLAKGDDTVEVSTNLPEDLEVLQEYYPEPDDDRAKKKFEGSKWYVDQERAWLADERAHWFTRRVDDDAVKAFLHHRMFVSREMEVIDDPRRLSQKVKGLVNFLRRTDLPAPRIHGVTDPDEYLRRLSDQVFG